MRVTSKGQVTIPRRIRERHGLMPNTEVEFVERDGHVIVQPATGAKPDRAERLIERLKGAAGPGMTTDEVLELTRGYSLDEL